MPAGFRNILQEYIKELHKVLGKDFSYALLYGSVARNEYSDESDVDIAIFTQKQSKDFYKLVNEIADITFEFSVKYDMMLSPVFINETEYKRMVKVLPYYKSIQEEGVMIG